MLPHDVAQSAVLAHCWLAKVSLVQLDVHHRVSVTELMHTATSHHVVIDFDDRQVVDKLLSVALVSDLRGGVVQLWGYVFIPCVLQSLRESHRRQFGVEHSVFDPCAKESSKIRPRKHILIITLNILEISSQLRPK